MTIAILLSTYNGAKFLPELLDSLLKQSFTDWSLVVRDDASTDDTLNIIRSFRDRFPQKVEVDCARSERLGAKNGFSHLIESCDSDFMMLCDQDDVWLPEKIEITLRRMRELEKSCDADTPLLVHTDLKVVDLNLNPVADSLWRYQGSNPANALLLNRLLVQNGVTGCTVMINRALKKAAASVPEDAIMHDWWLALAACALGKISHVEEPTVLYRQHTSNEVGAQGFGFSDIAARFRRWEEINHLIRKIERQGEAFLDRYRDRLTTAQREMLEVYSSLDSFNGVLRRYYLLRYQFFYTGFIRNVGRLIIG